MEEEKESFPAHQQPFRAVTSEARAHVERSIENIRALGDEVDAELLFIHLVIMFSLVPIDTWRESTHGTMHVKVELLAYHLFPLFKSSSNRTITPGHIDRAIELITTLFNATMQEQAFKEKSGKNRLEVEAIMQSLAINAAFVRGTAYPDQTQREIIDILGRFES
jgi:hypothetical protein